MKDGPDHSRSRPDRGCRFGTQEDDTLALKDLVVVEQTVTT